MLDLDAATLAAIRRAYHRQRAAGLHSLPLDKLEISGRAYLGRAVAQRDRQSVFDLIALGLALVEVIAPTIADPPTPEPALADAVAHDNRRSARLPYRDDE